MQKATMVGGFKKEKEVKLGEVADELKLESISV